MIDGQEAAAGRRAAGPPATGPAAPPSRPGEPAPRQPAADGKPSAQVATLRGAAAVDIDARLLRRAGLAVLVLGLVLSGVVLVVAGADRNAQVTALRRDGVTAELSVSGCLGEAAGSGSNLAGVSCRGSFVLRGSRYAVAIATAAPAAPGSTLPIITDRADPRLVATPSSLAGEKASWRVFVLPALLLAAAAAVATLAALQSRRRYARRPEERGGV